MRILDNLKDGYQILKGNNIPSYKIDCEILMSKILNISREDILLNSEKQIKKEEREYAKNREEYFREFHSVVAPVVVLKAYDYERKYNE